MLPKLSSIGILEDTSAQRVPVNDNEAAAVAKVRRQLPRHALGASDPKACIASSFLQGVLGQDEAFPVVES